MIKLAEGIQNALSYIEEHLEDKTDIEKIASHAYVSAFHFQRIFTALCGLTVGEYIRSRRLALAAQELSATNSRVIDVALKYGYDSPDSFARAFAKFHGISPSAAREKGASLKAFAPLKIKLTLEGGNMMEYKITEKAAFTVIGRKKHFNQETAYDEIPKFWDEHYAKGFDKQIEGMFGICMDDFGKGFDYYIADMYKPWNNIPEGCEIAVIPASIWAVFTCKGDMPKAIQDVNTAIWSEWLPNCKEYRLSGSCNLEFYISPKECEIWVPVERIEAD